MKILLTLLACAMSWVLAAQGLVVGTFNLRYDNAADTGNLWKDRAPMVVTVVRAHGFDVLGTQEGLQGQLETLQAQLPEYAMTGVGRDDGKDAGEHSAIFYRKARFEMLAHGDFWLSETPDKPGKGWDARCCNRLCSWVRLRDKAGGSAFYVFNAHYDHQGEVARLESSKLALKKIKELAQGAPVIFTGDLNAADGTVCYNILAGSRLLRDSRRLAPITCADNPTYHAFGRQLAGNDVIDHVFVSGDWTVKKWAILSDSFHGKYPSDHFPVLVELSY